MIRARRTPPTTPAEEPPTSLSSWTEGEDWGSSEFVGREDFGWGSGSPLEGVAVVLVSVVLVSVVLVVAVLAVAVLAFVVVVVVVVVVTLCVVEVDFVGGSVGSCTATLSSDFTTLPDPRLPSKT